MIDILGKINNGEISLEQANSIMDEIVDGFHEGELEGEIHEILCLDNYEWTAICHSLNLGKLADWRKNGWPKVCCKCGSEIDYKKYGWVIRENHLKGLNCC